MTLAKGYSSSYQMSLVAGHINLGGETAYKDTEPTSVDPSNLVFPRIKVGLTKLNETSVLNTKVEKQRYHSSMDVNKKSILRRAPFKHEDSVTSQDRSALDLGKRERSVGFDNSTASQAHMKMESTYQVEHTALNS